MIVLQTKTCMVVQYSNGSENSLKNKHVLEKHTKRPVGAPLSKQGGHCKNFTSTVVWQTTSIKYTKVRAARAARLFFTLPLPSSLIVNPLMINKREGEGNSQ